MNFRIYRASFEDKQKVNTYLEYFPTLEEAKKAPDPDNRKWNCYKVRYETFNEQTGKWFPISA